MLLNLFKCAPLWEALLAEVVSGFWILCIVPCWTCWSLLFLLFSQKKWAYWVREYGDVHGTRSRDAALFSGRIISPSAVWQDQFYSNSTSIWCCTEKPLLFLIAILIDVKWLHIWLPATWSLSPSLCLPRWCPCADFCPAHSSAGISKFSCRCVWTLPVTVLSTLSLTRGHRYFSETILILVILFPFYKAFVLLWCRICYFLGLLAFISVKLGKLSLPPENRSIIFC